MFPNESVLILNMTKVYLEMLNGGFNPDSQIHVIGTPRIIQASVLRNIFSYSNMISIY